MQAGAPRGRDATVGGRGTLLVPALLPASRDPPQISSPGPAPGPSPAWPWGPASRLFMKQASPGVTAAPTEWGRGDRWWRCHFNQSLQQLGKGRGEPRVGGAWDPALLLPQGPSASPLHLGTSPKLRSERPPDPQPGHVGAQTPMDSMGAPWLCEVLGVPWEAGATVIIS